MRARYALVSLLLVLPALSGADHLKYGKPACAGPVLDKKYFVLCYDPDRKTPRWVGYALTRDDVGAAKAMREDLGFHPDPALPKKARAENADYVKSGYDKGHMAPAADFKRSAAAIKSTFVLTNAVPQRHGANGGLWKRLEAAVRGLPKSDGDVWVISGPLFAGGNPLRHIGKNRVAVPTHTFKVVLCVKRNGAKEMFAAILPNIQKPKGKLADYTVSVNEVEKLANLDFFSALPWQEQVALEQRVRELPGE